MIVCFLWQESILTLPPCCPLYPTQCSTPTDLQLPSWQCYPNPPATSAPLLLVLFCKQCYPNPPATPAPGLF